MKRKLKLTHSNFSIPVFASGNRKLMLCAEFVRRMGISKDQTECTVEVKKEKFEGARQISLMDYYMDGFDLKWRFSKARDNRNKPILGWQPIYREVANLLKKHFYFPETDCGVVKIWVKIY